MHNPSFAGRHWILILSGMAVLGALVVFYYSRTTAKGSDDMQKLMARLDAMDAKIDAQAGRSPSDPWSGGVPPGAFRGAGARTGGQASQPPALPTMEQMQQDQARMRRELDAQFTAQGPAPVPDSAPQQVTAAFNSDAVMAAINAPQSKDVHCRAGMCLIQARFAPGAEGSDWSSRMLLEVGAGLPDYRMVSVPQPDGGYELRIYASRPGQSGP